MTNPIQHELYQTFDDHEVFKLIELWKLQWADHVQHMYNIRIPKREDRRTRTVGKPRKRLGLDENSRSLLIMIEMVGGRTS